MYKNNEQPKSCFSYAVRPQELQAEAVDSQKPYTAASRILVGVLEVPSLGSWIGPGISLSFPQHFLVTVCAFSTAIK